MPAGPIGAGGTGTGLSLAASHQHHWPKGSQAAQLGYNRHRYLGAVISPQQWAGPRNVSAAISDPGLAVGSGEQLSGHSRNLNNIFFAESNSPESSNWVKRDHVYFF